MSSEQYENNKNPLDTDIDTVVSKYNFGKEYNIVRVDNKEKFNLVKESLGMDTRARIEQEEGTSPVFEGLDFDSENIRTQAYYLENEGKPVAVITFVITPEKLMTEERYFIKRGGGVEICDFKTLANEVPKFTISPAWTKVDDKHRAKFALPGFKMIKEVLETVEEKAPEGSWIETSAQGKGRFYDYMIKNEVGNVIPNNELPFDINDFGLPTKGSVSTVKMAQVLEIPQFENVGSDTLGPVFAKKIIKKEQE